MKRKDEIQFLAVIALAVLISLSATCSGSNRDDLYDPSLGNIDLTGRLWRLEYYESTDGAIYRPDASEIYTLEFRDDLTLTGDYICNDCSGSYELGPNGEITLSFFCTDLACDTQPENPLDIFYLPSLYGATSYEIRNGQLLLHYRYIYRKGTLFEGNLLFSDIHPGPSPNFE